MPSLIPNRTFLLRGASVDGKKAVVAHAGESIEVTDEEAKQFASYFGESKYSFNKVAAKNVEEKK